MTGRIHAEYDASVLTRRMGELAGMLFGNGATEGQMQQVLKAETGQLAGRMGDAAGPSTQAQAMKKIDQEIKGQLAVLPGPMNLNQESESYSDFTWLYASSNALLGINDEDNQVRASGVEAYEMFRAGQNSVPRGNRYVELGFRNLGGQRIMRLNRVRVSLSSFNAVRKIIAEKTGQLRAACYLVAKTYVPSKRVPAWIEKKFGMVAENGKSRTSEALMGTPEASIEFAITSAGVIRNPRLAAKLQGAIAASAESIRAKLVKVAKGAKYVFETGQVYQPTGGEEN